MKYFKNIPTIQYGEHVMKNLTVKVGLVDKVLTKFNAFYPYIVKDGERPDTVAYNYYGSSNYVWLVFLSNNLVDPYYDWPMTQRQLDGHIIRKYGSITAAQGKIYSYIDGATGDEFSPDSFSYTPSEITGGWNALSCYAKEQGDNELRRQIQLLDRRYASQAAKELKKVLSG